MLLIILLQILILFIYYESGHTHESGSFETLDYQPSLRKIKEELYKNKFCHMPSGTLKNLLKKLGANDEDFHIFLEIFKDGATQVSPSAHNRNESTRNFLYRKDFRDQNLDDYLDTSSKILPPVPLRVDDPGFVTLNGGINWRPTSKLPDWMIFNSVRIALHKLIMSLLDPSAKQLQKEANTMTDFVLTDITIKAVVNDEFKQSLVSPEGIHQDGSHITLLMLGIRNNIEDGSAESRVFSMDVKSGPYGIEGGKTDLTELESKQEENERERFMIFNRTLIKPFEAVILLDQEVKHEGRKGLVRINENQQGERGIYAIFARRPFADGWEKEPQGVPFATAKDEFDKNGFIDGLFSESESIFKEQQNFFAENLKVKGKGYPGQTIKPKNLESFAGTISESYCKAVIAQKEMIKKSQNKINKMSIQQERDDTEEECDDNGGTK